MEFTSGAILADLFLTSKKKINNRFIIICLILESSMFIVVITFLQLLSLADYKLYIFVAMPIFLIIIYQLAQLNNCKLGNSIFNHPILQYLSKISYAFFLAQFFTWDATRVLQSKFIWFETYTNIKLICVSLTICLIIAILLHEIVEKPMSKMLKNSMYNKFNK